MRFDLATHYLPRRPVLDWERFELALRFSELRSLPFGRLLRVVGEFMMLRTSAMRSELNPSLRPISSGESTRFLMMNVSMEPV